jgi:hypothetical protein
MLAFGTRKSILRSRARRERAHECSPRCFCYDRYMEPDAPVPADRRSAAAETPPFGDRRRGDRRSGDRRLASLDRRGFWRGGRRAKDLVFASGLVLALAAAGTVQAEPAPDGALYVKTGRRAADVIRVVPPSRALPPATLGVEVAEAPPMRFGLDMDSVEKASRQGMTVSYGTFWVGAWTQRYGWDEAEQKLRTARKLGVTPVIQWWYWGDEISPSAVENGVRDARHGVMKNRATWARMSTELTDLVARTMGDREAIVVLETEFNKDGIESYEPFDGYLAEQAKILHGKGNIKVVIGFGNWGRAEWSRFDKAIAESDLLGTQLLQSSARDAATYMKTVDTLITGARTLQATFGKPSLIMDLALSSYPTATYETNQAAVIQELFTRIGELKAAGVRGIIWRAMNDDPSFDTTNYHGVAERHWGLVRADGTPKPAFTAFRSGVQAEASRPPASAAGEAGRAGGAP